MLWFGYPQVLYQKKKKNEQSILPKYSLRQLTYHTLRRNTVLVLVLCEIIKFIFFTCKLIWYE